MWTASGTNNAASPRERWAWVALLAVTALSRWAVAQDVLFEWDSSNYALSTREFDVFEHQPHPPGYPAFAALLRALSWLGGDITTSFLLANTLFGSAVLLLVGGMVRREAGPRIAWLAALGFALCPPFWHHGAASTAYVAECFCSVLVAWAALSLARRDIGFALAGALFALALGVRPTAVVTLGPLAVLGAALARPSGREAGTLVGAFGVACALWFVPLIGLGGGWTRYVAATEALADWQMEAGSALNGDLSHLQRNAGNLVLYLLDAANLAWAVLLVNVGVLAWRRRRPDWRTALFLAIWALPSASLYALHHLPKSGYVLTLAPIVFVAAALSAYPALQGAGRALRAANVGVTGLYLTFNFLAFFIAVPAELLRYRDADVRLPPVVLMTGDYGWIGLQYRTAAQRKTASIVGDLDPDRDLALFLFGAHALHRIDTWYHPDHWRIASSVDHDLHLSSRAERPSFGEFQNVLLHRPALGWPTWSELTSLSLRGTTLHLERMGLSHDVPLETLPRRIVVFYPCPPCTVEVGEGLSAVGDRTVGAGYAAKEVTPAPGP